MKHLSTGIACLLICSVLQAQSLPPVREPDMNKPTLFSQFPEKMNCRITDLSSLLNAREGELVNVQLADQFSLRGVVSSIANKDNGRIQSVVIRSMNYDGAVLSFSKIIPAEGNPYYIGRIISLQHGDAYEIIYENGQYILNRKGFYDLINE